MAEKLNLNQEMINSLEQIDRNKLKTKAIDYVLQDSRSSVDSIMKKYGFYQAGKLADDLEKDRAERIDKLDKDEGYVKSNELLTGLVNLKENEELPEKIKIGCLEVLNRNKNTKEAEINTLNARYEKNKELYKASYEQYMFFVNIAGEYRKKAYEAKTNNQDDVAAIYLLNAKDTMENAKRGDYYKFHLSKIITADKQRVEIENHIKALS